MEEPEKIVSQTELDDKAQKLVEEKDADSRLRVYVGPMEKALTAVLLIWAVFQVWANMFGTLGAVKLRTAHIMFLLPLAFTLYPTDALLTLSTCLDEDRLVILARRQREGEKTASLREIVNMAVRQ